MMIPLKIYGKVIDKKTNEAEYCIITNKKPIKVKTRGRWWIYIGTFGFQMSQFRFEECEETIWYEWKNLENYPRDCLGYSYYKERKKTLEDILNE